MKGTDPYKYAGTDVLKNRLGIRDAAQLQSFEYRRTAERSLELGESPIRGHLDFAHLNAIHKHLFGDIYDWAGQARTVGITKGSSRFALPEQIEGYGQLVFAELAKEDHLRGMTKQQFTKRIAFHFSEINALHPFREGNGRATRAFLTQLADEAGYFLDYAQTDAFAWNEASRASFFGIMAPVVQIFERLAAPGDARSALKDKAGPERARPRGSRPK